MGFILFLIAYILFFPLSIINYLVVKNKKGYFKSSAINIDKFGNREFRTLLNLTLRTELGYEFGNMKETISGVLGKNERDNTLSKTGKILVFILDKLDNNHAQKSIDK